MTVQLKRVCFSGDLANYFSALNLAAYTIEISVCFPPFISLLCFAFSYLFEKLFDATRKSTNHLMDMWSQMR